MFFIEKGAETLAHEIYLYSKYFKDSIENLEQLYQTSTDEIIITEQEKQLLFEKKLKICQIKVVVTNMVVQDGLKIKK